jgi:hypothetical protein
VIDLAIVFIWLAANNADSLESEDASKRSNTRIELGDVIEGADRFCVVTNTYTNSSGMPEAAVLCSDGRTSTWTDAPGSVSGFHSRVSEGCDPTIEALKLYVERLK